MSSRAKSSALPRSKPASSGSGVNWTGTNQPAYAMYGSSRSLPAYSHKSKVPFKIGKGGIRKAESYSSGPWPVYMDDKVLSQVRENTSKFIQHRITNVEKNFGDMCQGLGNYLRRLSKLRDSGDDFAQYLLTYAEKETHNSTAREALVNFAGNLAAVQDYRDSEIQRIDNKVLGPLTEYGTECKHAKEKLKQAFAARNKELKQEKNLNKAKSNLSDRHTLSHAETEMQKASVDATRASKQLENEIEVFERRKLEDIKKIFLDFVNIEMLFHARSLEMFTQCYQNLTVLNEDNDLEEFRSSLRPPSRLDNMQSGSKTSLNTTGISATHSTNKTPTTTPSGARKTAVETPNDTLNTTNRSSMYTDTQDDEDSEEDEDEDDDEESEEESYDKPQYQRRK